MWTISQYITATRILLQDTVAGAPRYPDASFQLALDMAFDEARRIRPDFFIRLTIPVFMSAPLNTNVPVPDGYRSAFIFYMAGWIQLADQEENQDARASGFLSKFVSQLMTTAS